MVVPVFDEAQSLEQLQRELTDVCKEAARSYEVIYVDDGSSDGTAEVLDSLAERDEHVTVVHLRRNFGKSPALAAGFEQARGEVVITMDGDLQDDPQKIPALMPRERARADLVSRW